MKNSQLTKTAVIYIEFKNNHTKEKNIFLHAKYFA